MITITLIALTQFIVGKLLLKRRARALVNPAASMER